MKRKGKIWVFIAAIFIIALAVTTFTGVQTRYGDTVTQIVKPASDIRFGIDIQGGVDVTFVPAIDVEPTEEQLASAQAVVEQRLVSLGITDYELYQDVGEGRIILRFPWQAGETQFDPETAIQELSTAAVLTFREGYETDPTTGLPTGVSENIILQGTDIESAIAEYGAVSSTLQEHYVSLTLSEEGAAKFAEATTNIAALGSGTISIWMDDVMISNPSVTEAITSNEAVITGSFDAESAQSLANQINSGALPFALQAESYSTISPTLGAQSLRAMVLAGIVALILVIGFMIINYRLPGAVSALSLIGQTAGTIALVSGYFSVFPGLTLTLPGIAGIILAIGIGVDANVITGERIKEELRSGKKLDAAIKSGFQRGLAPIIDSNMTVLIISAILMGAFGPSDSTFATVLSPVFSWFGPAIEGTIYSFGYTLFVGVLLNFVFGVGFTRIMLYSVSRFNALRNTVWYGGLKEGQTPQQNKPFNIISNRRRFFMISAALLVLVVVASFGLGVQMDVQFRGGAIITYGYTGTIDTDAAQTVVSDVLGEQITLQTGEDATGGSTLSISMPGSQTVGVDQLSALSAAFEENFTVNSFEQLQVNNVEPSIGQTFLYKCLVALLLASALILLYIGLRFRKIGGWRGGLTAVVALLHDLAIVFGVFVLFGIPLSGNFIAVLLTILGYSINDTVVIYDRIRENANLYGKRMSFPELVNISINQSLKRSVNTTVSTLLALGSVCIFSLVYGLDTIFTFAFPLMIGMLSGVYSTVCIAGPLWVAWENRGKPSANDKKSPAPAKPQKAVTEGEKSDKTETKLAEKQEEQSPENEHKTDVTSEKMS